jgi:hypothetical protein
MIGVVRAVTSFYTQACLRLLTKVADTGRCVQYAALQATASPL